MAVGNEESREQLDAVIADFLEAVEAGESIDQDQWLDRHPRCAAELQHFFDNWHQVQQLAAPLRGRPGGRGNPDTRVAAHPILLRVGGDLTTQPAHHSPGASVASACRPDPRTAPLRSSFLCVVCQR